MIDFYVKDYFEGLDITTILPFTTIQRIFNNREVRKQIGLDISDESTFTKARMQLVIDASMWILSEADTSGIAVTRLFNKARSIEDKLLPWIQEYMRSNNMGRTEQNDLENHAGQKETAKYINTGDDSDTSGSDDTSGAIDRENSGQSGRTTGSTGSEKYKYQFWRK